MQIHATAAQNSWRGWLKGYPYTVAVALLLWSSGMVCVVVLALVATILDKMLTILDQICDYAENLLLCPTVVVATGYKCSHKTLTIIEVEPKRTESAAADDASDENFAAEKLLEHFHTLQRLFLTFNRLLGPIVLVTIVTSTLNNRTHLEKVFRPLEKLHEDK